MAGKMFVYGLTDPSTKRIRYVGFTTNGMKRPLSHSSPSLLKDDTPKNVWVRRLNADGHQFGVVILQSVETEEEGRAAEKKWIGCLADTGEPLLNIAHCPVEKITGRHSLGAQRMWQRRGRPILDLTSRKTYQTQREAAAGIGCSPTLVCFAVRGLIAAAKGHRLRWLDECPDANVE